MNNFRKLIAILSLFLGMLGFIAGLITISLEYNLIISILLLSTSLLSAIESSFLFNYPTNKLMQAEKLDRLERKFKEATTKLHLATQNISQEIINRVVSEVIEKNKDES